MTMDSRNMIKGIYDGKNLEEFLPQYANRYISLNRQYGILRLTMEYFTIYQIASEEENPSMQNAMDTLEFINNIIRETFSKGYNQEESETTIKKLHDMRNEVIKKMQILTSYTDKLQIYEYVLNRLEFQFEENTKDIDDVLFVQKLTNFIFSPKDNIVINENIKQVLGQLPVRMTKSKYFELLRSSLSNYIGADKSALDGYLYMLRTSAMLYEPEGVSEYFTDTQSLISELEQINYSELSKEEFQVLTMKIQEEAIKINEIADIYIMLEEMLNNLYVIVLADSYIMEPDDNSIEVCKEVILEINQLFDREDLPLVSEEVESKLYLLEGQQEKIHRESSGFQSALEVIKTTYNNMVSSLMLGTIFERLYMMEKLLSPSIFIDLCEENLEEQVDSAYVDQITGELIVELKELFHKHPQIVNRAVMANTLDKMPVFFNTSEEVVEYAKNSLEQCRNQAEKKACIQLLTDIIEENSEWQQ